MKLTKESIKHNASWKGYRLPQYDIDIDAVREATHKAPTWLHFGAGNLFRAFPAGTLAQRLLTAGLTDTGIICCDGYDEELIDRCYRACDHLSLSVTLYSNGTINKEIVASVTESPKLSEDGARLKEVFTAPSLQMVTFTITEKGYAIQNDAHDFLPDYKADMESGPDACHSFFGKLASLCLSRVRAGLAPLALASLDNCSDNGVLSRARHCAHMTRGPGCSTASSPTTWIALHQAEHLPALHDRRDHAASWTSASPRRSPTTASRVRSRSVTEKGSVGAIDVDSSENPHVPAHYENAFLERPSAARAVRR